MAEPAWAETNYSYRWPVVGNTVDLGAVTTLAVPIMVPGSELSLPSYILANMNDIRFRTDAGAVAKFKLWLKNRAGDSFGAVNISPSADSPQGSGLLMYGGYAGASDPGQEPLDDGTTGYWPFYEGAGVATLHDVGPNSYDATIYDIIEGDWGAGHLGSNYAIFFDGSGDGDRAVIGSGATALNSAYITQELVGRWHDTGNSVTPYWLDRANTYSATAMFYISNNPYWQWRFRLSDTPSTPHDLTATTIPSADEWVHLVGMFSSSGVASLYVNGVLEDSDNYGGKQLDTSNFQGMTIGAHHVGQNNPAEGDIASVRTWNYGLSADEVGLLYRAHLARLHTYGPQEQQLG